MTIITAIITVLLIILLHLWWYITSFFCTFHTGCELNSVRLPSDYPECLQHLDYKYLPNSDLSTFDLKSRVNLDWNCSWSLDTGESTRHDSVLFSFTSAWSWSLVRCSVKILALNPTINIRLRMMLNSSIPLSLRLIPELIRKITSAVVRLDSRIKFSIIWKLGIMLGLTGKIKSPVVYVVCSMSWWVRGRLSSAGLRLTTVPHLVLLTALMMTSQWCRRSSSTKALSSECCSTNCLACFTRYDQCRLTDIVKPVFELFIRLNTFSFSASTLDWAISGIFLFWKFHPYNPKCSPDIIGTRPNLAYVLTL